MILPASADARIFNAVKATTRTICAYCPDFDPRDPVHCGASHGICAACEAKLHAQMDARA